MPSVVAAKAYSGSSRGLLASDSTGHLTDSSWKCTGTFYTGWMLPDYDDSSWPTAKLKNANGDKSSHWWSALPANFVYEIPYQAFWIWASDADWAGSTAYCRQQLKAIGIQI